MAAAPCIFALGIVNTRVYNIADNLGNFGVFFYLTLLRINEASRLISFENQAAMYAIFSSTNWKLPID